MRGLASILSICFYLIFAPIAGQEKPENNPWETLLNDVKVKYVYAVNYDTYLPKLKFGEELKKLDGKEITIKGFFLPVDVTGNAFVISYNPMDMCFFCDGSGIETIVEISGTEEELRRFKRLKTDNYIIVKGSLELNANNYEHLPYILNNSELIEIIK